MAICRARNRVLRGVTLASLTLAVCVPVSATELELEESLVDCDDWASGNKSFHLARLTQRMREFPLAPLLPAFTLVLFALLRLFRRGAASSADSATKPIDGMAQIGVPVDQSWRRALGQLLRILGAAMLAFIAAWVAFHFLT